MPASRPVAIHRLLENLEIDWHRLRGPALERDAIRPPRGPGQVGPLTLENFRSEHLRSSTALRALHRRAVARGLLPASEAGLIRFVATAAYCLRVGRRPAALFVHLVRRGIFPASLSDEDRALSALRRERAREREACSWLRPRTGKPSRAEHGGPDPAR